MNVKACIIACLLTICSAHSSVHEEDVSKSQAFSEYDSGSSKHKSNSYTNYTTTAINGTPFQYPDAGPSWQSGSGTTVIQASSTAATQASNTVSGFHGPPTVNAVDATLKWWYNSIQYLPTSTVQILYDPANDISTGWTIYPATETVDLTELITTESCAPPTGTLSLPGGKPVTLQDCEESPAHVAAKTTAVFYNAFITPSATTGYMTPLPDLRTTISPFSAVIGTKTFSTGIPYVQFSRYEVVRCAGQGSCRPVTQQFNLTTPYAFRYTGPAPSLAKDVDAVVTGRLDAGFPAYINRTSLVPGSWSAPPTVIVIVEEIIVAVAVLAASIVEQTAQSLALPTPTLPPGFSRVPPTTPASQSISTTSTDGRVEVTERYLLLPDSTTSIPAQQQITTAAVCKTCDAPTQLVVVAGITLTPTMAPIYLVGDKTACQGQGAITVSGKTISAFQSGSSLIIKDKTSTTTVTASKSGVISADGLQVTITSAMMYYTSSYTLYPGSRGMTLSGLTVALGTGNGILQIGGQQPTAEVKTVTNTQAVATTVAGSTSETSASVSVTGEASRTRAYMGFVPVALCAILMGR